MTSMQRNLGAGLALVVCASASGLLAAPPVPSASPVSAVSSSSGAPAIAAPSSDHWASLDVVQRSADGQDRPVRHRGTLHTGDQIALFARVLQRRAFVCVVHVSPNGVVDQLLPCSERRNLGAGELLRLPPDPRAYFPLDTSTGSESLALLVSEAPIPGPLSAKLLAAARKAADRPTAAPVSRATGAPASRLRTTTLPGAVDAAAPEALRPLGSPLDADHRGLGEPVLEQGPYVEFEGGHDAVAIVRFDHRP